MEKQPSSSRRQIPSLRPRTLDARLRSCSCCSSPHKAQIHSGSRRRPKPSSNNRLRAGACSSVGLTTTWGAKRARTALDRGSPFDSSSSLPHPNWRDWANLGDGPAGLIAESVLANDVAGYVRFRAVCRPWRRSCADPRAHSVLDSRFHPRRWVMIDRRRATPVLHRFLNVSTGDCIHVDLPELSDHKLLRITTECLLVLLDKLTHNVVRLLNPLTRQLTDLPPLTTLLPPEQRNTRSASEFPQLCSFGLAGDSTVAAEFCKPRVFAIAKPDDESWTLVLDHIDHYLRTSLTFQGRFYCVSYRVMQLDLSANLPPRLQVIAKLHEPISYMSASAHLVDNGGELILVHRKLYHGGDEFKTMYEVYRVDLDAGMLIPVKTFGGRAVFLGMERSVSISAEVFHSIAADTIYLGFDCVEKSFMRKIDSYHLPDGSTKPPICKRGARRVHPRSVIDCLSRCISDTGENLA